MKADTSNFEVISKRLFVENKGVDHQPLYFLHTIFRLDFLTRPNQIGMVMRFDNNDILILNKHLYSFNFHPKKIKL